MPRPASKPLPARRPREIARISISRRKQRARLLAVIRRACEVEFGVPVGQVQQGKGPFVILFEETGDRVSQRSPSGKLRAGEVAPAVEARKAEMDRLRRMETERQERLRAEAEARSARATATSGESASDPVARTRAAYLALIDSSLTVAQTARRLNVDESRVRQRLGPSGDLYGFKFDNAWRVPAFLFDPDGRLVPNLGRVARALPGNLEALEVEAWLRRPHPDLQAPAAPDRDLSPWEWISMGRDPETVIRLAEFVGVS